MFITDVFIQDLVNFRGKDNLIHFSDGFDKGFPNELYVFIGQNNSGKSSILQLMRACTDLKYLRETWEKINTYDNGKCGIVLCRMIGTDQSIIHIACFYKKQKCGMYIWATLTKGGRDYKITCMNLENGKVTTRTEIFPKIEDFRDFIVSNCEAFEPWEECPEDLPWTSTIACLPRVIVSKAENITVKTEQVEKDVNEIMKRIGYNYYALCKKQEQSGSQASLVDDKKTAKRFDVDWLPEGHQYLWNMAIHMAEGRFGEHSKAPCCLIIDEPTRCMHPSLVQQLSSEMKEYCRKYMMQLIITSHSPAVLRANRLTNVYLGARMPDGSTNIRYIYHEKLDDEEVRLSKKNIIGKRLEEVLFSRIVMIVEGEADRRILTALLFRMSSSDPFREWMRGLQPPLKLDELTTMMRDITVISAGGKNGLLPLIQPLEAFAIPYFMVADGDFLIDGLKKATRKMEDAWPYIVMREERVRNLFTKCDLLKDACSCKLVEACFSDKTGLKGLLENCTPKDKTKIDKIRESHEKHTNQLICDCVGRRECQKTENNIVTVGSKSMPMQRLRQMVECAFRILLVEDLPSLLNGAKSPEGQPEGADILSSRQGLSVEQSDGIPPQLFSDITQSTEASSSTDEQLKSYGGITKKMPTSFEDPASQELFASYAEIFAEWFRLFTWRERPDYDLEAFVMPYVLESLSSRVKELRTRFPEVIKVEIITPNELVRIGRLCMQETQKGGIGQQELKELFDEYPINFQPEKPKLWAGCSESQVLEVVDAIVDGKRNKTLDLDLEAFVQFLGNRILPYYMEYGKTRKFELIDDSINWDASTLRVKGTLKRIEDSSSDQDPSGDADGDDGVDEL